MKKLYDTYENCSGIVGVESGSGVLLPVSHTKLKAHITVTLDAEGQLLRARAQEDTTGTIAPSTEDSESRTSSSLPPHPLVDKLQYLAGDYAACMSDVKAERFFRAYIDQLEQWCSSTHGHPMVRAVYTYLSQERLIADLVDRRVLFLDDEGHILDKWTGDKDESPDIFKIKNLTPSTAMVRFEVEGMGLETCLWKETSVRDSFVQYINSRGAQTRLCYVSGLEAAAMDKHPKKIVGTLANAKLISSNDSVGFTYRGRFRSGEEAVSVSAEVSQKAHTALRWLVETRGLHCDTQTIVAFSTGGQELPNATADSDDLLFRGEEPDTDNEKLSRADAATSLALARRLGKALLGFATKDLDRHMPVVVMALDSATVGKLAISFYREMIQGEYLERVADWHASCIWLHIYRKDRRFVGAPALRDIAAAAYGDRVDARLRKEVVERLMPCVFDGAALPGDIVTAAVRRASQPQAMGDWEWEKTLSIACALYRKQQHEKKIHQHGIHEEGSPVALDETRHDRDYLYGRLLAVADWVEQDVLRRSGEKRQTNAMRHMSAFSQHPFHIWKVLEERLRPYLGKLEEMHYGLAYKDLMTDICDKFVSGAFEDNTRLNGSYLLGYHCQRQVFKEKREAAYAGYEAKKLSGDNLDAYNHNEEESK